MINNKRIKSKKITIFGKLLLFTGFVLAFYLLISLFSNESEYKYVIIEKNYSNEVKWLLDNGILNKNKKILVNESPVTSDSLQSILTTTINNGSKQSSIADLDINLSQFFIEKFAVDFFAPDWKNITKEQLIEVVVDNYNLEHNDYTISLNRGIAYPESKLEYTDLFYGNGISSFDEYQNSDITNDYLFKLISRIYNPEFRLPQTSLPNNEVILSDNLEKLLNDNPGTRTIYYENLVSGETYSYYSNQRMFAASTIKFPLVLYVLKQIDDGELSLTETKEYKGYHKQEGSGDIQFDPIGTNYTIDELIDKAILDSDNTAYVMLRERVGFTSFYNSLKDLGATNTVKPGSSYSSSYDMGIFLKDLYSFQDVNAELYNKLIYLMKHTTEPSNIAIGLGQLVPHKAGWIDENLILNDVALVFGEESYIISIFTDDIKYENEPQFLQDVTIEINNQHNKKID